MKQLSISNLFDFMNTDVVCENFYYHIGHMVGNTLLILGIKDNKIIQYSNEWLYLIKNYYYSKEIHDPYKYIVNYYYTINHLKNTKIDINEDVIIFISSFSSGTVHGYTFILYAIDEYMLKYKDKKILIFEKSQKGLLDLIKYIIPNNMLIIIKDHQVYNIKKAQFIQNIYHSWDINSIVIANNIVKKYFIINNYNKYNDLLYKSLCIIKNNKTENITNSGVIEYNNALSFSKINNSILIDPSEYDEVDLINILYRASSLYVTFGTAYLKNVVYLSDLCKKITCLFTNDYLQQYNDIYFDDKTEAFHISNNLTYIKKLK